MTKDLLHTIIGFVLAGVMALDTYLNKLEAGQDLLSFTVIVGALSAVAMAVYGKWAKKGDNSAALSKDMTPIK